MGSIGKSWALVKASARVLEQDRELLVFPLISGVATALVAVSFLAPLVFTGGWTLLAGEQGGYLGYVLVFLFYLAQYTVIFFFNSALVGAALIRMQGGDPTVADGLRIALSRLPAILGYAAISATVGMVLRAISERTGWIGRLVVGLVGMGWTLATFLAVPVLVTRNVGPVDAVKESAALFRRTWGEQVVGNVGMGWAFTLVTIAWTLAVGGAAFLVASVSAPAALALVAGWVLGCVVLSLVATSLKGIYTAALYRYATQGEAAGFDPSFMGSAFRPRG
ncbi:MAG: DUF6159 family protein [Longimicrobiales bacterium]|nr:DUF6159 family protein [Longimicrobiales bacterium]